MGAKRWAVRVTYADGNEAYLRHGARIGYGSIVKFDKKTAEINADFLRAGVDEGDTVTVVQAPSRDETDTPGTVSN